MIEVITDDKHRVAKWAKPKLEGNVQWANFQAFGFERHGDLVGAVVFTEYTGNDIHVSVVTTDPCWWHRRYIKLLYEYVFDQCGCIRISALVNESNRKSIKLLRGLGSKEEGRLRSYFNPKDGIVFGQLRSECKWLER